ncbi:DUF192 domain-containing protein [Treponema sp. HNW]|uniref:DUF192 domain-containing protein n=1 Tax=Treponema sp. HNW TaxID=3116654 RepID=UPI003D0E1729
MKNRLYRFYTLCLFMIFCVSCRAHALEKKDLTITKPDGTEIMIRAELARTQKEQMKGYMERTRIPEGTGMLFLFDRDQILSFWMKNTPTALSIAYIDSHGTIRELYDMTPFSLASVKSTVSLRYALEVPQGWFQKNGIVAGSVISIP